jgi:HD-GYP domain-containing protein (c-di-GMP phosphodiesterase class II)
VRRDSPTPPPTTPLAGGPPRPVRGRRHSLVLSVLAVLTLVGLAPLGLLGWQVARSLRTDLEANQMEIQLDKAKTIEQEITRYVGGHFDRLESMAIAVSHLASPAANGAAFDSATFRSLLEEYVGQQGVLQLQLVFPGALEARSVRVHSESFDPGELEGDLGVRTSEALEKGRRGSRYLSNPFIPAHRGRPQPLAVLAIPLQSLALEAPEDRPVLVAVIDMSAIQDLVQRVGGTGLGYNVFVLDDEFRPFAHAKVSEIVTGESVARSALVKEAQALNLSPFSKSYTQEDAAGRGTEMIGTYHPVALDDHRWGVFVEVERELGLFQVHDMVRTTVRWGLLAFALAIVIGIVFSWRVTSPIHALAETTRRIAEGDYGRRVKVRSNNEIGMLADNFNLMTEEIGRTFEDLKLAKELNDQLFISSIRSLAAAIDARDPYTRGHSERVTRYARIIARQLQLPPDQVRNVEIGALLHDVGKIGIEDRILRKPAALTPEEFEIMKTHPEKGGDIMEPIGILRGPAEIIIHHHERYDGTGYPSGLKGEDIPLGARVVNVADTFDAMTTNRPYQRAMTFQTAARKIGEFSGKACDPRVVVAFQAAFEAGLFGQVESAQLTG